MTATILIRDDALHSHQTAKVCQMSPEAYRLKTTRTIVSNLVVGRIVLGRVERKRMGRNLRIVSIHYAGKGNRALRDDPLPAICG